MLPIMSNLPLPPPTTSAHLCQLAANWTNTPERKSPYPLSYGFYMGFFFVRVYRLGIAWTKCSNISKTLCEAIPRKDDLVWGFAGFETGQKEIEDRSPRRRCSGECSVEPSDAEPHLLGARPSVTDASWFFRYLICASRT